MFERAVEVSEERLDVLGRLEVEAAQVYVRQADALLDVWDAAPVGTRVSGPAHVLAEAALVLNLHPASVEHRFAVASALRDYPLLPTLMRGGRLGVAHALVAVEETGELNDTGLADRVLHAVLASGGRLGWDSTPGELRRALRRTAVRLDPVGAARRRAEQTAQRTGVRLRALADGLAALTATGQGAQVTAAHRLLGVLSEPAGPDDARTGGQRQVDALIAALVARAGQAVPLDLQLNIPAQVTGTAVVSGCPPEPLAIATDLTPDLLALLTAGPTAAATQPQAAAPQPEAVQPETVQPEAARAEPGRAEAGGAEPARAEPALALESEPVQAEAGHSVAVEPGPEAVEPVRAQADQSVAVEPASELEEQRPEAAHAEPPDVQPAPPPAPADVAPAPPPPPARPARRLRHQGVPEILDHGPVDPALLAELLTDPRGLPVGLAHITVRRVCIDPTGQAVAIDDRAVPLQRLLAPDKGKDRRRGRPAPTLTAAALLGRLLRDLPAPPPATDSYTPTAAQQRLVHARDTTCTFPGCARRARRSELDHRIPHPHGATSVTNLHPVCKHHHRLKHDGWTCTRSTDGTTTWTSPHGQRVTVAR